MTRKIAYVERRAGMGTNVKGEREVAEKRKGETKAGKVGRKDAKQHFRCEGPAKKLVLPAKVVGTCGHAQHFRTTE